MIEQFFQSYQHLIITLVMMIGLYAIISHDNLVKKLIGLGLMQTSVFLFFIFGAQLHGGDAPVVVANVGNYVNPLPHVLILTAIVVSVASTAMGLALVIAIDRCYQSLDEASIDQKDKARI